MSSILDLTFQDELTKGNVTTRRPYNFKKNKMASGDTNEKAGSLIIEDILSQDEAKDVVTMLSMADEVNGGLRLPSFCTSTQMGGRDATQKPRTPPLSPVYSSNRIDNNNSKSESSWSLNENFLQNLKNMSLSNGNEVGDGGGENHVHGNVV